jgi:hypothetical protein
LQIQLNSQFPKKKTYLFLPTAIFFQEKYELVSFCYGMIDGWIDYCYDTLPMMHYGLKRKISLFCTHCIAFY